MPEGSEDDWLPSTRDAFAAAGGAMLWLIWWEIREWKNPKDY
jgi:hypothetical protein